MDEMTTVNLDVQRMYRASHDDRTAITVGPGLVSVPRWVADEWAKPHPDQQAQAQPELAQPDFEALFGEVRQAFDDLRNQVASLKVMLSQATDEQPKRKPARE